MRPTNAPGDNQTPGVRRLLSVTDLTVHPLALGGNVFGWTADDAESMGVLDAYAEAGGNFIDTADVYSNWAPGNRGGESETIIGRWLALRCNRDRFVIATKVGSEGGLKPRNIREKTEASLRRLCTEYVDLLYVHADDGLTPPEVTLGAMQELVEAGKVRHVGVSNYTAPRLSRVIAASRRERLPKLVAFQVNYSLAERSIYEGPLRDLCERESLACVPYFALAKGFLTGKYRPGAHAVDTRRAREGLDGSTYLEDARRDELLVRLEETAIKHDTTMASIALAWLLCQRTVAAVAASARTPGQLADLLQVIRVRLDSSDHARLSGCGSLDRALSKC